jgi:flagellar basal-body rod protein FlgF
MKNNIFRKRRIDCISSCVGTETEYRKARPLCATKNRQVKNMDPLLISAASGMKARIDSLDVLANNIANSGTAGFKSDQEFYNLYAQELPVVQDKWTDFSQGTITMTGNPLNLALSGKGLFAVNSPSGTLYTRNGDFRVSKSDEIESAEGYTLRNTLDNGRPIKVDGRQTIEIDTDGMVRQGGQTVGQIELAAADAASEGISKMGSSYFALTNRKAVVPRAEKVEVRQGAVEQSNVPVAESAVKLVGILRQFEMLQKAMNLGAEMNKQAITEVARVS